MAETLDEIVEQGMNGQNYNFDMYDDLTYSAWMLGRKMAGKKIVEYTEKQDGATPRISLHPANWR